MKIYVGNLSYNTDSSALMETFSQFGEVVSADVVSDRETGRSKGFGFVEMPSKEEAEAAITELNGKELDGRTLNVNEARPKTDRNDRGGSRGGSGGGSRGGSGGGSRGGSRW